MIITEDGLVLLDYHDRVLPQYEMPVDPRKEEFEKTMKELQAMVLEHHIKFSFATLRETDEKL